MKIKFSKLLIVVSLFFLGTVLKSSSAEKPWTNATEVSVLSSNGNTRSNTTSAKNTFNYKWSQSAFELIFGGLGARNKGETVAEKYFANEKYSYKLSDRNYAFEKFGWDKDRFAGIKNRYESNLGLGRELIKRPTDLLIFELGGGYVNEERENTKVNDFSSGRAYSKYTRTLSPTANFSQDAEYIANFEDKDDFRVNTETALTATLTTHLSLKVGYTWKHVGKPAVGFGRNDTTTSVALIANY